MFIFVVEFIFGDTFDGVVLIGFGIYIFRIRFLSFFYFLVFWERCIVGRNVFVCLGDLWLFIGCIG